MPTSGKEHNGSRPRTPLAAPKEFKMNACFVLMPFGGYFDAYYARVIKPAVAKGGLVAVRSDEIYGAGAIIDDIHRSIMNAAICIADVTGRNPNVSYELGMAHALGKPVLIITQDVKDIPFDYQHLRAITYDPRSFGWETPFIDIIARSILEVTKNPTAHKALKAVQSSEGIMLAHLKDIFFQVDCFLEKIEDIYCDENCNALVKTRWNVTANSDVYHLCDNRVSERTGTTIEVRRVYDKLSGRVLDHVVLERGDRHLTYLILLKQFKTPGQAFVLETEVYVEGYLDGLTTSHAVTMSHQATAKSGIKYVKKVEHYHFPNTSAFAGIFATFLSHPRKELVGTCVQSVEADGMLSLEIVYDSDQPYRQETGAVLRVPLVTHP